MIGGGIFGIIAIGVTVASAAVSIGLGAAQYERAKEAAEKQEQMARENAERVRKQTERENQHKDRLARIEAEKKKRDAARYSEALQKQYLMNLPSAFDSLKTKYDSERLMKSLAQAGKSRGYYSLPTAVK